MQIKFFDYETHTLTRSHAHTLTRSHAHTLTLFAFLFLSLFLNNVHAQGIDISYNTSNFQGGNNIGCHGGTNGWITIVVVGGQEPYFFNWSNGAYIKNISNLSAGNYTVVVTDFTGNTASVTIPLYEPEMLNVELRPFVYEGGYNISREGGSDGSILTRITGGTGDCSYLWSNSSTDDKIAEVPAGTYTVNVTDLNGCTASASTTLLEPGALQVVSISSPVHNGYNISCREGADGAINLVVGGGVPPYTYSWNNGMREQNIGGLHAGHYSVIVRDAAGASITSQIDLTEPSELSIVALNPLVYPNGKNLSCADCNNGRITSTVTGGVTPYSYLWEGQQTTPNISNLPAGNYSVTVTDANGCTAGKSQLLYAPERDDWTMSGNTGSDPNTHFIGTSDNRDFVFRTNNMERLKVYSTGEVHIKSILRLNGFNSNLNQTPIIDSNGILRQRQPWSPGVAVCTIPVDGWFYATSGANDIAHCSGNVGIGTSSPMDLLDVKGAARFSNTGLTDYLKLEHNGTNALINKHGSGNLILQSSLILDDNGRIGIGVTPPLSLPSPNSISDYSFFVDGGIMAERIMVALKGSSVWPDYVFSKNYKLKNLDDLEEYISINRHLPGIPSANEAYEGVDILKMQIEQLIKIEELTLYVIQLKKDNEELRKMIKVQ